MSRLYGSSFSGSESYSSDHIYNLKMKTIMCYLKCNPDQYVTLEYAEHTYLKITTGELVYQPLSSMYNYLTVVDASNTYLQITNASTKYALQTTYLKIVDASNTYLNLLDASNTYLQIMDASNNYLKIIDASNNYLKIIDASNNYLQIMDASNNYLQLLDASNNYLQIMDASNNYLQIIDASNNYALQNTYLKIADASTNYLKIADASTNYLKIADASNNYAVQNKYLKIADASNNYLANTGIATSIATLTTFTNNGLVVVEGYNLQKCINYGASTIFLGINPANPNVGGQTTVIGNNAYTTGGSVSIGSSANQATITSSKTTYGVIIGFNAKSSLNGGFTNYTIVIGANSTNNSGSNSIILGSNTQITLPSDKPAYAIGYGANATIFYQMMLGTSSETVYCPGNPSGGQTPNTCLVLSSNVTLNTIVNTPPTTGQLGYQFPATINVLSNNLLTVQPFATFTSLPVGVWYITGSINVTQNSGSSENVLLQYSLSTSSSTQDPTKYGFLLSNCNINNTFGFNYNNIIINNAPSQTYYLVIQKTVTGSSFNYQSNTNASYLIASRIA